jgi:hypothetical protein
MSAQAFNIATSSNIAARAVTAASQAIPAITLADSPSAAQLAILADVDYRITVVGTQAVFLAYAPAGATAPVAAIPADGAVSAIGSKMVMIEGAMSYTLRAPAGAQFAAISGAIGSTVYISASYGVAL